MAPFQNREAGVLGFVLIAHVDDMATAGNSSARAGFEEPGRRLDFGSLEDAKAYGCRET